MRVGFIGLGQMGRPMAASLLRSGHELSVWNRTPDKADDLVKEGARRASSPADAATGAEVVITMLSNDVAVQMMVLGGDSAEAAIAGMERGSIHLSMSTISPALSHLLAQAHASFDQGYVAAPVFGRPDAAAHGTMSIAVAGADDLIDRCRPLLESFSRRVVTVGDRPELANVVKLAGNFLIATMVESLGEAFTFIDACSIPGERFLDIITGVFQSPLVQDYGRRIADRAFDPAGFRLSMGLKDVRLLLDAAEPARVSMPIASLLRDRFLTAEAHGLEDRDWSIVGREDRPSHQ